MFVSAYIGDDDAQQEVGLAGNRVALDDLRHVLHGFLEAVEGVLLMALQRHVDEDVDGQVQLLGIQQRHPAANQAAFLQALDAPPAWGVGEPNALAKLLYGEIGGALQFGENVTVHAV